MKWSLFAAAVLGLVVTSQSVAIAQEASRTAPLNFRGRYLVSVSDADMLASAYVNGRLGPREGRDALSVIPLGQHPRDLRAYETEASNSVAGPPNAIAVTPDGRYAFVVETFRPRPDGNEQNQTFADLRQGNLLMVFDLRDPTRPAKVQELAVGERPTAVSVNFDGSMVAVTFHPSGAGSRTPLALFPFQNGRVGQPVFPTLSAIRQGQELIHAE